MKHILPLWAWLGLGMMATASLAAGVYQIKAGPRQGPEARRLLSGLGIAPGFAQWVAAYAGGPQSVAGPIRVRFVDEVDSAQQARTLAEQVLTLTPAVAGKLSWEDARTLAFTPSAPLERGQVYAAELALGKVFTIETEAYRSFKFAFRTQVLAARITHLGWAQGQGKEPLLLEGDLELTDYAQAADIEKAFACGTSPQQSIIWRHEGKAGRRHHFSVHGLARGASVIPLALSFATQTLGGGKALKVNTTVPAKGSFTLWHLEQELGETRTLIAHFSEPLAAAQDKTGLIGFAGQTALTAQESGADLRLELPDAFFGPQKFFAVAGLKAASGLVLAQTQNSEIDLSPTMPGVRATTTGYIIPTAAGELDFAFEARSLSAATVQIYRVEAPNVPEYLATVGGLGDIASGLGNTTLGRPLARIAVNLSAAGVAEPYSWGRYKVSLAKYLAKAPGALHYVQVSFSPGQMLYKCTDLRADDNATGPMLSVPTEPEKEATGFDEDSYGDDNNWYNASRGENDEDNYGDDDYGSPCSYAYSYDWRADQNGREGSGIRFGKYLLRSDLGLMARRGGLHELLTVATDLNTAKPEPGVTMQILGKQHQVLASLTTDADGFAHYAGPAGSTGVASPTPYLLIAHKGSQYGYLSLATSQALDMSAFDISGAAESEVAQGVQGTRGFLYAERGVYRPGDTLHLGLILQGYQAAAGQPGPPAVMTLQDNEGRQIARRVAADGAGQRSALYRFNVATETAAPTGIYTVTVKAGGQTFSKYIPIETVKPNRIRIKLDLPNLPQTLGAPVAGQLAADYFYGAPAAGLRYSIVGEPHTERFSPKGFEAYTFTDPSREPEMAEDWEVLAEAKLDAEGKAQVSLQTKAPGQLLYEPVRYRLTTSVFEAGGDISVAYADMVCHPQPSYLGLRVRGASEEMTLREGQGFRLDIADVVATTGRISTQDSKVELRIVRLDWAWWWDRRRGENIYVGANYEKPYRRQTVSLGGGKATLPVTIPEYGRYYVQVINEATGTAAGQVIYVGYPESDGRSANNPLARLRLSADKVKYKPGEQAIISIPGQDFEGCRALVSLERGTRLLRREWAELSASGPDRGKIRVQLTAEDGPGVYASVSVIRPYSMATAARPLRQYGVLHLSVEAPGLRLAPTLTAPTKAEPGRQIRLAVAEKSGRPMRYTIAMVDEGLLSLTGFATPDPAKVLGARRALQTRAYDLYDNVILPEYLQNALLAAVGGDAGSRAKAEEARNALRFQAISRVYGPFYLEEGARRYHELTLPEYTGQVRWMVVACNEEGSGSAQANTTIRTDLVLEATAPRVLSAGETVLLPVELQAMIGGLGPANLTVRAEGGVRVIGQATRKVALPPGSAKGPGARVLVPLQLQVTGGEGMATVGIVAQAGGKRTQTTLHLPIRLANPEVRRSETFLLQPGEVHSAPLGLIGVPGTNRNTVEVSGSPQLGLESRLDYLIHYPYGCLEQTVSAGLAQLMLPDLATLPMIRAKEAQANVQAAIGRIARFKTNEGFYALWPGDQRPDFWASAYAQWFLSLAAKRGYTGTEAPGLASALETLLRQSPGQSAPEGQLSLAFGCLALGGGPAEARNRLAQTPKLSTMAGWMLAAAMARAGQVGPARQLAASLPLTPAAPPDNPNYYYHTYGSPTRDMAIVMLALTELGRTREATALAQELAKAVRSEQWLSTQDLGWAMVALASTPLGGRPVAGTLALTLGTAQSQIAVEAGKSRLQPLALGAKAGRFANQGKGPLYVTVTRSGVPAEPELKPVAENLAVAVRYTTLTGKPMDISSLKPGTEVLALITVENRYLGGDLEHLALTERIPGCFEIRNDRLASAALAGKAAPQSIPGRPSEYDPTGSQAQEETTNQSADAESTSLLSTSYDREDIRDDKIFRFFSLARGKSRTFTTHLVATYSGQFIRPAITCEAMYTPNVRALAPGGRIKVE